MRWSALGFAAALSVGGLVQVSDAVVQPKGMDPAWVAAGKGPRLHRDVRWSRSGELAARGLSGWTAMIDSDTDVPLRLWGPGVPAPNVLAEPAVAETVARRFLADHLDLLAPGASITDFH